MKKIIITILLFTALCLGQCLDSIAMNPFNIDLKQKVTDGVLEEVLGRPDTMKILNDINNVHYIYSNKMTCYFLMDEDDFILYAIELTDGNINEIKIGMSKRKVLKYLGKPNEIIITKNRIMMEWICHEKHTVMAEFENKKLQNLMIANLKP